MHLFTLGFLAILFPRMMFGMIQEAKSWDEFEALMRGGGSFALVLCTSTSIEANKKALDSYCVEFKQFKCYYGVENESPEHETSFDKHFKNKFRSSLAFFKDGVQICLLQPSSDSHGLSTEEIRAGFNKAK
nr:putative salivary protein [Nilaparvata lugens]